MEQEGKLALLDMKRAFEFYYDISKNAGLPSGFIEGNGYATVEYTANGEASDWMLGRHGIYAMSPELGTSNKNSEDFFLTTHSAVK